MPVRGSEKGRSDTAVISYLAYLGILLAVGVDISLPAFDELDAAFGLSDRGVSVGVIGTVYILGMAIGQLVYGVASDRFGRRPTMLFGIGLYSLGVVTAIAAPTLEVLLAGRLLWGLGAAAPFVLRQAIARDLYAGDRMARVITIVTAVFLLGPIFVPIIGAGILLFAPWQGVFVTALLASAAAVVWTLKFGETLDPALRRPLQFRPLVDALRLVVTTRTTIGHIGAQTLASAAFFIWLGSAQPIIDDIYDRGSQFAFWFAASGVVVALALLVNGPMIDRFGARRVAVTISLAFVATCAVGVADHAGRRRCAIDLDVLRVGRGCERSRHADHAAVHFLGVGADGGTRRHCVGRARLRVARRRRRARRRDRCSDRPHRHPDGGRLAVVRCGRPGAPALGRRLDADRTAVPNARGAGNQGGLWICRYPYMVRGCHRTHSLPSRRSRCCAPSARRHGCGSSPCCVTES